MAESAQYINSLVETSPTGDDYKYDGAAHMRVVKSALKNTFSNINGEISATDEELNAVSGVAANIQTQLSQLSNTLTTLFNNASAVSSTLEAIYASTSASLRTQFSTLSSTLEAIYAATSSALATRFSDLESEIPALKASLSSVNTYFNEGRDVMPKHFASIRMDSSLSFFNDTDFITFHGHAIAESTAGIVATYSVGASPLPSYIHTKNYSSNDKYTKFITPPLCTRARVTFNITSRYGDGSFGTLTSGDLIFYQIEAGIYNSEHSALYSGGNYPVSGMDGKQNRIRMMQEGYNVDSITSDIAFKILVQLSSSKYNNYRHEFRELTVSNGSFILPFIACGTDGSPSIVHNIDVDATSIIERFWVEVEYR